MIIFGFKRHKKKNQKTLISKLDLSFTATKKQHYFLNVTANV